METRIFTLLYYLKHLVLRLDCYKYTEAGIVNLKNSEHEII